MVTRYRGRFRRFSVTAPSPDRGSSIRGLAEHGGQRGDDVARDQSPRCGRRRAARPCAVAAAAAARRGSSPFARNAARTPVRTSPVPAVASPGASVEHDERAAARAGDDRVRALEQADAAEPLGARAARPRAGARPPSRSSRRAGAPSSPACGVSTARAPAVAGLEPVQRVGVETSGMVAAPEQLVARAPSPQRRGRDRGRSRAHRAFAAASTRVRPASASRARAASPRRPAATLAGRRPRRSRRRRGTRPRRRGTRRRSCPARRRRRAPSRRVYLLSSARLRGTSARIAGVARRCAVSPCSSPMSATTTSPAWKRPGATASPTLRPWKVTVSAASTAAPATSPGGRVDARRDVDGDDRDARGVDPLDQRRPRPAAARRGSPCRRARR